MKRYADLLADAQQRVREVMPWDLKARLDAGLLLIDVREPAEFGLAHIPGSINVPRGVLEGACEWGYDDTVPALAAGRARPVVVVCRSGNRSLLAAEVMQRMGFCDVVSLKTGVRGWNDFEQTLIDGEGRPISSDAAEPLLASSLRTDQRGPHL